VPPVLEEGPLVVDAVEFEVEVAVKGATEVPATEHVEMKADCAALTTLLLHMLAMALCTSCASSPHTADRSPGLSWVLTALSRHAGGRSAKTLTVREARTERMMVVFIFVEYELY